jgi:hypothetical protein
VWLRAVKSESMRSKFVAGREVRGVPVGLVVLAGRNQSAHVAEGSEALREPNLVIFERLARTYGRYADGDAPKPDPAFDVTNPDVINYAANIVSLIEWKSISAYEADMRAILAPS